MSINYYNDLWNWNEIIIDNMFAFSIVQEIMYNDYKSRSIIKCRQRNDWPKWKEAIQAKLTSLAKRDVFGLVAQTLDNVKPIKFK